MLIPAAIEFVDIAGLVAGASKGEGLGNQFLANIREVDAIIQVVRCFEDPDVMHNMGSVDPVRDIEVINTELVLADLEACEKRLAKAQKQARGQDKEAIAEVALLEKIIPHLNTGKPANLLEVDDLERALLRSFFLLTGKPILYACQRRRDRHRGSVPESPRGAVAQFAREHHDADSTVICAKLESDLVGLSDEEAREFLSTYGRHRLRRFRTDPSHVCTARPAHLLHRR